MFLMILRLNLRIWACLFDLWFCNLLRYWFLLTMISLDLCTVLIRFLRFYFFCIRVHIFILTVKLGYLLSKDVILRLELLELESSIIHRRCERSSHLVVRAYSHSAFHCLWISWVGHLVVTTAYGYGRDRVTSLKLPILETVLSASIDRVMYKGRELFLFFVSFGFSTFRYLRKFSQIFSKVNESTNSVSRCVCEGIYWVCEPWL
jgi:hypothetical protein